MAIEVTEPYIIDPKRVGEEYRDATGIYVRAQTPEGKWVNADIAQFDKETLDRWMDTFPDGPRQVVHILLGHK